jgi:hypothetical protein
LCGIDDQAHLDQGFGAVLSDLDICSGKTGRQDVAGPREEIVDIGLIVDITFG